MMKECPPLEHLRQMLDARITSPVSPTLEAHVETCPKCQALLEELTEPEGISADTSAQIQQTTHTANCFSSRSPQDASSSSSLGKPLSTEALRRLQGILPQHAHSVADNDQSLPQITGYELLSLLGRGGMGVVYAARDLRLDRMVAIKRLNRDDDAHPEDIVRFRSEAQTIAQLQHPNIVRLYDFGSEDNRPYYVLELVDGGHLAEFLQGSPQSPKTAAQLVETLSRAIHFAHQQGIVHRDLKPSNVLLQKSENTDGQEYGTPKISDFGLAKLLDGDLNLTRTGEMAGTPAYMSPEQIRGESRNIGPATDVYSLGVILYELLTGRPPFLAATALETVQLAAHEDPVAPNILQRGVPRDLAVICEKCLQKEPHRRYQSAQDLAEDLQLFLRDLPIKAREVSRAERYGRWARRNPVLAGVSTALVVAILVATTIVTVSMWQLTIALQASEAAKEETGLAERDAMNRLWQSHLSQARAARFSRQSGQRVNSLEALGDAARIVQDLQLADSTRLALRNEAIACLALQDMTLSREFPITKVIDHGLAYDPVNSRFALARREGGLTIRSAQDGRELFSIETNNVIVFAKFSFDGNLLVGTTRPNDASKRLGIVWDVATKRKIFEVENVAAAASFSISSDSARFLFGLSDRSLETYDATGNIVRRLKTPEQPSAIAWDPAGQRVAVSAKSSRHVHVLDAMTGDSRGRLQHPAFAACVNWNPQGDVLAVGCFDNRTYLWNMRDSNNTLRTVLEGHQSAVVRAAFHPNGHLIATQSWDGTTRLWDPVDGNQLVNAFTMWANQWNASGTSLAGGAGGKFQLWQTPNDSNFRLLHHGLVGNRSTFAHSNGPWSAEFGRDDRLLASASFDGVRLWDTATGGELAHLKMGSCVSAIFQSDGTLLTHANRRLLRWPIVEVKSNDQRALSIGPPENIPLPRDVDMIGGRIAQDASGHCLALCERGGEVAVVWHTKNAFEPLRIPMNEVTDVCLSSDGKFVAVSTWNTNDFQVWDVADRRPVLRLEQKNGFAAFSPDSTQLVIGTPQEFQIWKIGNWNEPFRVIPRETGLLRGNVAFSDDGRFVALAHSNQAAKLLNASDWTELATLEAAGNHLISGLSLTSDGSKLAVATENHTVQVWDLRTIRKQLKAISLDWQMDDFAPNGRQKLKDLVVKSVVNLHRGIGTAEDGSTHKLRDASALVRQSPNSGEAHFRRGILHFRNADYNRALVDFENASRLQAFPKHFEAAGWMYVCLGRYQDGILKFRKSLKEGSHDDWDIYRRAIADLALGERDRFRASGRLLFERHHANTDPWLTDRAAKLSLLEPDVQLDKQRIFNMAQRSADKEPLVCWFPLVKGMAEYRLNRYQDAVASLRHASNVFRSKDQFADATILYMLAMSHYQLSETSEAEKVYGDADKIMNAYLADNQREPGRNWHDWLMCEIVRREAELLIARD